MKLMWRIHWNDDEVEKKQEGKGNGRWRMKGYDKNAPLFCTTLQIKDVTQLSS